VDPWPFVKCAANRQSTRCTSVHSHRLLTMMAFCWLLRGILPDSLFPGVRHLEIFTLFGLKIFWWLAPGQDDGLKSQNLLSFLGAWRCKIRDDGDCNYNRVDRKLPRLGNDCIVKARTGDL